MNVLKAFLTNKQLLFKLGILIILFFVSKFVSLEKTSETERHKGKKRWSGIRIGLQFAVQSHAHTSTLLSNETNMFCFLPFVSCTKKIITSEFCLKKRKKKKYERKKNKTTKRLKIYEILLNLPWNSKYREGKPRMWEKKENKNVFYFLSNSAFVFLSILFFFSPRFSLVLFFCT